MKTVRPVVYLVALLLVLGPSLASAQRAATTKAPPSKLINATALLEDVKMLSADDMEGRSPTRPSIRKARDYVRRRFLESGIQHFGTGYEQEFTIQRRNEQNTYQGINYIGFVKGTKRPGKYIVVTAHYDHVGVQGGEIYNGADDNASGTGALFAIAKALQKDRPDHSVIFVAFDAEELGLRGSKYFVEHMPVSKTDVLLNVNMDMVSRNEKGELYAAGAFRSPWLRPLLEKARLGSGVKLLLGHDDPKLGHDDWTDQSDQGAFNAAGIPFVYFGVEDHKDYHKPTDDFERIMPAFYVRAVETILLAVRLLDRELSRR